MTEIKITDIKFYVLIINLSLKDNIKLIKHLKSGLKRRINWNKNQTKKQIKSKTDI